MNVFQIVTEDIPRLYTGIAEWMSVLLFIILLPRRYSWQKTALAMGPYLFLLCGFLYLTRRTLLILWFPCMLICFVSMYLMLRFLTIRSGLSQIYFTVWAILLAELAASFEWQIETFFIPPESTAIIPRIIILIICYAIVYAVAIQVEHTLIDPELPIEVTVRDLMAAILIMVFTFVFSNISFFIPKSPFSGRVSVDISRFRTLVDLGGLAILYAFQSRLVELNAKQELATISNMLKSQYESYRSYQETIDLINFKYHDLKNQLLALVSETDAEKRDEYIKEMQKELEAFRPERQTGSAVLDTIIASKSLRCRKMGIQLTCVAEGKLLEQMPVTDICTIFGNALDNAIEYEAMIPDVEKRLIHLTLTRHKSFIYIECSNYCPEKIKIKNGLPLSTKSDHKLHGYGVKSIAYAVRKNKGSVHFGVKEDTFEMKVLIPVSA